MRKHTVTKLLNSALTYFLFVFTAKKLQHVHHTDLSDLIIWSFQTGCLLITYLMRCHFSS